MASLPTFSFKVDATNAVQTIAYRHQAVQFGDGYKQITATGINRELDTWDVVLPLRNDATVAAIKLFFQPLGQHQKFLWQPPREVLQIYRLAKPVKYQAAGLDRNGGTRTTITLSFDRVFEQIPLPSVDFTIAPSAVAEGDTVPGGTLIFTATRSQPNTSAPYTVNFTVSGTGVFNTDYTVSGASSFGRFNGTLLIPSGQMSAAIAITPIPNTISQSDRTIVLSPAGQSGVWVVGTSNWTGTIVDDEPPTVSVISAPGGFTLILSAVRTVATSVNYDRTEIIGPVAAVSSAPAVTVIPAGSQTAFIPLGTLFSPNGFGYGHINISLLSGTGYIVDPNGAFRFADTYYP